MTLTKRIEILNRLKEWLARNDAGWKKVKTEAFEKNKWFTAEFIDHRIDTIIHNYLDPKKLEKWVQHYHIDDNIVPQKVGIVMAGNIPLVGFHDFLCCFIAGHKSYIKLSEKDSVLFKGIVAKIKEFDAAAGERIFFAEMLKGCDAYLATGSNNTSRYFEYYFGRYPSIIRRNRTSVAVLSGLENAQQLAALADDVFLYFGLGCRNVTQLYVPRTFDFERLLTAFMKYKHLKDHTKFRNNYDYNLALLIMNSRVYMSNDCVILVEGDHLFSPVSELYYSFYDDQKTLLASLSENPSVQCILGNGHTNFGDSQNAELTDYPDGIDTMQFLLSL